MKRRHRDAVTGTLNKNNPPLIKKAGITQQCQPVNKGRGKRSLMNKDETQASENFQEKRGPEHVEDK